MMDIVYVQRDNNGRYVTVTVFELEGKCIVFVVNVHCVQKEK